jgi:RNA recognition motif-containing protein
MQIYVGNLPLKTTDESLRKMFAPHGTVKAASIGKDKDDKPQGYGFVDMPVKSEARNAIEALRGKELDGKPLLVRALKPDDEFHQHALATHGGARAGFTAKAPRGNIAPRAGGAVRRSGKRGS